MSATAVQPLTSSRLRVADDLNRESLPQTHRDPLRKVTWMNAVCASVLTVGILLTKKPAQLLFHPEIVDSTPVMIPEFVPDTTPQIEQPQDQVEETTEQSEPTPAVATVVVANSADVAFAVPVNGPTVLAKDFKYVPPPPRIAPKSLPSRPSGPTLFTGDAKKDGGYYPKVDYPRDAMLRRETGEVRLYVVVSPDGTPEKVEVKDSSGFFSLDRVALAGVRRLWHWPPGERREYIVPIEFVIR